MVTVNNFVVLYRKAH